MSQNLLEKLHLQEEKNILIQGLPSSIEKQFVKLSFAKNVTPLLKSRKIDFALVFAVNESQLTGIMNSSSCGGDNTWTTQGGAQLAQASDDVNNFAEAYGQWEACGGDYEVYTSANAADGMSASVDVWWAPQGEIWYNILKAYVLTDVNGDRIQGSASYPDYYPCYRYASIYPN